MSVSLNMTSTGRITASLRGETISAQIKVDDEGRFYLTAGSSNTQTRVRHAGLGDTIASVLAWFRVPGVLKWLKIDCRCGDRRKWLNRQFPYRRKMRI